MVESIVDMLDQTLRQELALPGVRDLIPTPGDLAHALFGGRAIDSFGKSIGQSISSGATGIVSSVPKLPG